MAQRKRVVVSGAPGVMQRNRGCGDLMLIVLVLALLVFVGFFGYLAYIK